jgi:hypothetical protein
MCYLALVVDDAAPAPQCLECAEDEGFCGIIMLHSSFAELEATARHFEDALTAGWSALARKLLLVWQSPLWGL